MSSNNSNASREISKSFQLSFKKIALYNFIFMGICLVITAVVVFFKYSNAQIKKERTTIIAIIISCLLLSNIFILAGVYIAKRLDLSPFTQVLVALLSFVIGYAVGYYLGQTIGNMLTAKKKGKVDKDTAALQAAIALAKKKPEQMSYNKQEMEAKEEIEKAEMSIKSLLGINKKKKVHVNKYPFKYSYGISFRFFIEAQPSNVSSAYSKFVNILNYGDKPSIKYKGDTNELKITFRLKDENQKEILLYDQLKYQKWNHFIINYDHGTVDVFINNKLVATEEGIAPYMMHDEVVVGENNGINGGIKDVKYYPDPIDLKTIKYLFRMY